MTKRNQRVGIWVITIVMAVGSIGLYFVAVLANSNNANSAAQQAKIVSAYTKELKVLDAKYYPILSKYTSNVGTFDKDSVTKLETNDLQVGTGATITANSSYLAYYIGFNPSGKVFDESISGTTLKDPLPVTPGGLITGWNQGMVGAKLDGVRELTIPSSLAYGDTAQGADIPANTPLKFIVLSIPIPKAVSDYNTLQASLQTTTQ